MNRFSWISRGWCGTAHGWALLFLETIVSLEPQIWGKMCHPHQFIRFKSMAWVVWFFFVFFLFFLGKNLKLIFGTPFPQKNVIFIFVVRRPVPSKMVMSSKNNFSLLFWKILFYSKKLFNEKYSKRQCQRKWLYWLLSPDTLLRSKWSSTPTNGFFFGVFSKNTAFIEKLVL